MKVDWFHISTFSSKLVSNISLHPLHRGSGGQTTIAGASLGDAASVLGAAAAPSANQFTALEFLSRELQESPCFYLCSIDGDAKVQAIFDNADATCADITDAISVRGMQVEHLSMLTPVVKATLVFQLP